ncbi:hydrogenobyrinic acid a,c-diamide synthase (glutamine-hydrolysing) /cobyrinate a,c-diamide synthase [Kushneria avicenniae]|uniref:Hydrogenobyrinic acid a,c-diamide synthase (Glutamine-hydrolysing) /cobyrinate a,c-diamide synthase n=1 Tax=Kushneria avicenniae TaxID=402385 RepID=A0A1I1FW66_9GAMM|nr:cobyrinate a,c-diamide synthase [Kushneria avicenniae]SFC01293.1 hydrogenobyrinic acid a,c-diamide synthase (glutamine-hydrolysing) /cobyrinate a,c-diamide synthase [Kushneria avicenniae]
MADTAYCPALFLSAMASGQGKTTVTAALARYHRRQGRRVTVFKTGPDYLDPQILAQASNAPVEPLDLWMAGDAFCREQLHRAALTSDLILIEGAMGLHDGTPSSADLAVAFDIPVVCVINARGMAQTVAAIGLGLARYRPEMRFHGLVANALGSERHRQLIEDSLPEDVQLLAAMPREERLALPSRHLGLVQPGEQDDPDNLSLEARLEAAADLLEGQTLTELPPAVAFASQSIDTPPEALAGKRIGIARDAAFSFVYAANVRLLEAMGAELCWFSPLADTTLPEGLDALWLPGGYPELHAETLGGNHAMCQAIRDVDARGLPIVAECGGMLYLQETLTDRAGTCYPMAGVLPGHGEMRTKRGCQGMQSAPLPEGEIRGHAHHHSRSHDTLTPMAHGRRASHPAPGEAIFRRGRLTASYLHLFFPSNPAAVAALLGGVAEPERSTPTGQPL